ncbi:MAG: UDP-N-acetylmuramoyl-L-alanyl-D-glutamate--2,6-diaminopimelate ligase [Planctomycetota bacterium]|nr:UDP-N-acetylmuramoyl-L-alanyl-D-glutamate--2,6-diaminopimelate ligase [Planctomycetota bacterium]
MRLSEIRSELELVGGSNWRDVQLQSITADSREVRPGSLFVAVPGTRVSGVAFVEEAVRRGAAAVISPREVPLPSEVPGLWVSDGRWALSAAAARFYSHPSRKMRVVGVTGTNGKTTTTYLLRSMLRAAGYRVGLIGTTGYFLDDKKQEAPVTTPDAIRTHELLAAMTEEGITHAVMETSSHALDQLRVRHVEFDVGIFTNLTGDHLDYHRDVAAYLEAKAGLFRQLSPRATAVLNQEDLASSYFMNVSRARTFSYGFASGGHMSCRVLHADMSGTDAVLGTPIGQIHCHSPLKGVFNLSNIMAAASGAIALGLDTEAIRFGIENLPVIPGRLESVEAGQPYPVIVDYAHTEDALRAVLTELRHLVTGRLIVVFGCGGDRDRSKRPHMGMVVEKLADLPVVTSDNPRTEDPDLIIKGVLSGMVRPERARVVPDRREAFREAFREATPDDLVLLAGKGHENTQTSGDGCQPFDDREEARALLEEGGSIRVAS